MVVNLGSRRWGSPGCYRPKGAWVYGLKTSFESRVAVPVSRASRSENSEVASDRAGKAMTSSQEIEIALFRFDQFSFSHLLRHKGLSD